MGELIPFYRPAVKPPKPAPVAVSDDYVITPAGDILREALKHENTLDDVLLIFRDADGQVGFVTNLADNTESIVFLHRLLHRLMLFDAACDGDATPPPQGISS